MEDGKCRCHEPGHDGCRFCEFYGILSRCWLKDISCPLFGWLIGQSKMALNKYKQWSNQRKSTYG